MNQVSWLYYALDKVAYESGQKSTNLRFHGFRENMVTARPSGSSKILCSMVDPKWLADLHNSDILFSDKALELNVDELNISDHELTKEDLEALAEWENERVPESTKNEMDEGGDGHDTT